MACPPAVAPVPSPPLDPLDHGGQRSQQRREESEHRGKEPQNSRRGHGTTSGGFCRALWIADMSLSITGCPPSWIASTSIGKSVSLSTSVN